MKCIQVIDGALNCGYSIYEVSDDGFAAIFPEAGQDVEFIDDFIERVGEHTAKDILDAVWQRRIAKAKAQGIHGTLFFELDHKKRFYPNKRESDLDDSKIQGTGITRKRR